MSQQAFLCEICMFFPVLKWVSPTIDWRIGDSNLPESMRTRCFRTDGLSGQRCFVLLVRLVKKPVMTSWSN